MDSSSQKRSITSLAELKGKQRVVCLTAYDAAFASFADRSGVDLILVGDSVGNVLLGYENTVPVTMAEMIHHTSAVCRGVSNAVVVADLPFGSYGASIEQSVNHAVQLVKAGANAVKLEGDFPETVHALVKVGIPVMGHLGMTPQSVNTLGEFKKQGKTEESELAIRRAASNLASAGAFGVVFELMPSKLSSELTKELSILTIGIGAGTECDGEIQVLHDVLGFSERIYKHSKAFLDGKELVCSAIETYADQVRSRKFPIS